ncbi:MAG: hypothetical protein ACLPN5_09120 [Roseiarcus sp.]
MNPKNRQALEDRVIRAAEGALARQEYVSAIDVLLGLGWLDASSLARWRQGRVESLERVVQANLARVSEAMKLFRGWASQKGLKASETRYVARSTQRGQLRFSVSGDAGIERLYRTHWVSPKLSERKRERLQEKASRPPELIVISPHNQDWKCWRCGGTAGFLMMENEGPSCMNCAGLGDLVFLPAGDAKLTRLVKAKSQRTAVVVRFSRSRKRYERQGLLVERSALSGREREEA